MRFAVVVMCACGATAPPPVERRPEPVPERTPAPPPRPIHATDLTLAIVETTHAEGATQRSATFTTSKPLVGTAVTVFDLHTTELSAATVERVGERYRITVPALPASYRNRDPRDLDLVIISPAQPQAKIIRDHSRSEDTRGQLDLQSTAWRFHRVNIYTLDTGVDLDGDGDADVEFGIGCVPNPRCHDFFTYVGVHDGERWHLSPTCGAYDNGVCTVPPPSP